MWLSFKKVFWAAIRQLDGQWGRLTALAAAFAIVFFLFFKVFNFDNMYAHLPPLHQGRAGEVFGEGLARQSLARAEADEISGLAPAHGRPGALWGHNDSGDQPRLFLFTAHGADLGTYTLPATARDWEDLAAGWLDSTYYLFVGDIGDNDCLHDWKYIYRLPEPSLGQAGPGQSNRVVRVDTLTFSYPDGRRDVETLLYYPPSRGLFLVSKRERRTYLYALPYPQPWGTTTTARLLGQLPLDLITSGDISANGQEVLLKSYQQVYYWRRRPGEAIEALLRRPPMLLPYAPEPRGEAIAFALDGTGYFTLGEDLKKYRAVLYFYPRE
jgi:hypothetical protein